MTLIERLETNGDVEENWFYYTPLLPSYTQEGKVSKVLVTDESVTENQFKLPIAVYMLSSSHNYMYIEESLGEYVILFSNELIPGASTPPIGHDSVVNECGFWGTVVHGLGLLTLEQTRKNIKEFISSNQSKPIVSTIDCVEKTYTFDQIKYLVNVIRGDMSDKIIKQILELEYENN